MEPNESSSPVNTWERDTLKSLLQEYQRERRSARRWRIFKTMLTLLVISALVFWVWGQSHRHPTVAGPHTAVVVVDGAIQSGGQNSAENIIQSLKEAFEAPNSEAVVLLFNSPGGSPVQAGMVFDEVMRLKALHGKPIYAVVEEMCASAAYYMAAATDEIFVDKASVVGSIGVLMDGFGFTQLMDKLGVERRLLTAGENKGFLDPFSPQTPAQKKHAKELLETIHQQFIDAVKRGRGERLEDRPDVFSGLFWTGAKAVELGLADDFGTLDYVAREVVKAEDVVDYTLQEDLQERLVKQLGASVGSGLWDQAKAVAWQWR